MLKTTFTQDEFARPLNANKGRNTQGGEGHEVSFISGAGYTPPLKPHPREVLLNGTTVVGFMPIRTHTLKTSQAGSRGQQAGGFPAAFLGPCCTSDQCVESMSFGRCQSTPTPT